MIQLVLLSLLHIENKFIIVVKFSPINKFFIINNKIVKTKGIP